MVGGFVEEEDVGLGGEGAAEEGAAFESGGHVGDAGVGIEVHFGDDGLDLSVGVPAGVDVELVLDLVEAFEQGWGGVCGELVGEVVVFGDDFPFWSEAVGDESEDGAVELLGDLLGDRGDDDVLAVDDGAGVGCEGVFDEFEEGGFSGAVASKQAESFGGFDLKVDVNQQGRSAVAESDVL